MKIVCLCGSPKGELSVTMQYVKYLMMNNPGHQFEIIHVARNIYRLERNEGYFWDTMDKVKSSDIVIWAFPLYILNIHGDYKRFIELVFERRAKSFFSGKYSASLSTSINFFDNMAHNYINAISDDLDMYYLDFFSAHMGDLNKKQGQRKLLDFMSFLTESAESQIIPAKHYSRIDKIKNEYVPSEGKHLLKTDKKVVIISDSRGGNADLMIKRFRDCFESRTELYYLEDVDIKGGCRGCLKCGPDNVCFYEGKDGYKDFYDENLIKADIIIFAGSIKDRFFSSRWKTFFDRRFLYTHRKTLIGKQIGFLVSGPLSRYSDLKEWVSSYFEVEYSNVIDMVSDEGTSEIIDKNIEGLARRALSLAEKGYVKPITFRGIGGTKIFRDEVFSGLKVVFKADHRDYKRTGIYDFPQKSPLRLILMTIAHWITSIGFIKKKMFEDFPKFMVRPYRHLFARRPETG